VVEPVVEGFDLLAWAIHKHRRTSPLQQPDFDSGDKSCMASLELALLDRSLISTVQKMRNRVSHLLNSNISCLIITYHSKYSYEYGMLKGNPDFNVVKAS
jgi:hypothetical protein